MARKNILVRFPECTLKLIKTWLNESNKEGREKGMIVDFLNKGALRLLADEKGSMKEEIKVTSHTQKQRNQDKEVQKEEALTEKFEHYHEVLLYLMQNAGLSPRSKIPRSQMDQWVIITTNCSARSLPNKYKELLAHKVLTYHLGEYRVREKTDSISNVAVPVPIPVQEEDTKGKAKAKENNIKNEKEFDDVMKRFL